MSVWVSEWMDGWVSEWVSDHSLSLTESGLISRAALAVSTASLR